MIAAAALRIVLLLLFIGVYGYIADWVGGRGLAFVAVTIVPIVIYFTFVTLYTLRRRAWSKEHETGKGDRKGNIANLVLCLDNMEERKGERGHC